MNPLAGTIITAALVFYSIGVWGEVALRDFHKFSVFVWAVWLIPYFSPMFFAMAG